MLKNDDRLSDTEFRNVAAYLEDMQTLHDFFELHPYLIKNQSWYPLQINVYVDNKEALAEMAKELGKADKSESDYYYTLKRMFGKHTIEINCQREKVCTKVKTGTKIVQKRDPDLVSQALDAIPMIEVEEDVFDWSCPDSILKPSAD